MLQRSLVQLYYSYPAKYADDGIDGINFVPPNGKVNAGREFVMVVVITFAKHENIKRHQVTRGIVGFKANVAIFMGKPVNDGAVNRAHKEMDGQQQIPPRRRSKDEIEGYVDKPPHNS